MRRKLTESEEKGLMELLLDKKENEKDWIEWSKRTKTRLSVEDTLDIKLENPYKSEHRPSLLFLACATQKFKCLLPLITNPEDFCCEDFLKSTLARVDGRSYGEWYPPPLWYAKPETLDCIVETLQKNDEYFTDEQLLESKPKGTWMGASSFVWQIYLNCEHLVGYPESGDYEALSSLLKNLKLYQPEYWATEERLPMFENIISSGSGMFDGADRVYRRARKLVKSGYDIQNCFSLNPAMGKVIHRLAQKPAPVPQFSSKENDFSKGGRE